MTEQIAEEWRSLNNIGFSKYEVSDLGRVRNVKTKRIKVPNNDGAGYLRVHMSNDFNVDKSFYIHKLVAIAFLQNLHNKTTVDHINRIRDDNRVINLRWADRIEQKQNQKKRETKLTPVCQLDLDMKLIKRWKSIPEAAFVLNINLQSLYSLKRRNRKIAGYYWYYEYEILTFDNEVWKPVPLPDYVPIEVSSQGRVKLTSGKITFGDDAKGYRKVAIQHINGKKKVFQVHRLVAMTFLDTGGLNIDKFVVNHKNGIKTDNRPENLEFITHQQNCQHAHDTGLNKTKRPVIQYDLKGNELGYFDCIKDAAVITGVSACGITMACKGQIKTHRGFIWKYV